MDNFHIFYFRINITILFCDILINYYLCNMNTMDVNITNEVRQIIPTPQFDEFYYALPKRVQTKMNYVINAMATIYNLSTKFVKHLHNTDLYEMRVSIGSNEYRTILFAVDNRNFIESTKVILLNGFLKKSEKDYKKHIDIAINILQNLKL